MENIYTQAVADAKAVRESAMANAKAAIQEAFEPKIKAMLKKHIVESDGMEDEYDEIEEGEQEISGYNEKGARMKTIKHATGFGKAPAPEDAIEDLGEEYDEYEETMSTETETPPTAIDETSLDEILAELDALEETDDLEEAETDLEEAYEFNEAEEEEEEETEEETEEDEDGEEESEESTEETKVVDITLGDLVDAIKAAMATETPATEPDGDEMPEAGSEEMPTEDNISFDEILSELEDEMEETTSGASGDIYEAKKKKAKEAKEDEEKKKAEKELKEAKKAITAMRAELNEINLLNAKLLYVNKIFKSKSLTEAQKVKVLNAFDKATTIKEVKNTYSIVSESVTAAPKKQLKESYGFASKPSGMAPKGNTVESDPFLARMQKLAGL